MKVNTLKFKFHTDPGHGWLEVPRKLLRSFRLMQKISSFSYQNGNVVYLEEDNDAPIFLEHIKKLGYKVEIETIRRDYESPIRNYSRFNPEY